MGLCSSARLAEEIVPFIEKEAESGMPAAPHPKYAPKPASKPLAQRRPYPGTGYETP